MLCERTNQSAKVDDLMFYPLARPTHLITIIVFITFLNFYLRHSCHLNTRYFHLQLSILCQPSEGHGRFNVAVNNVELT